MAEKKKRKKKKSQIKVSIPIRNKRSNASQPAKGKSNSTNKSGKSKKSGKSSGRSSSRSSGSGRGSRITLNPLREQLQVLVRQANERAQMLIEYNLPSRALMEAQRSWARQTSRAGDETLFKSDLKRRTQIEREFARVHAFLNDYTSTVEGAKDFTTDISRLTGQFGSKWNSAGTGQNYNTDIIDEKIASKAFELYRKVIERAGGWERAVGMLKGKESLIGYGSENLIANIYDMVENEMDDDLIINIASEQIEAGLEAYEEMASKQRADYDYGVVFDDEDTKARKEFYMWKFRYKRGLD